jgi:malonyl-CoA/methylmalonyl-CoA synthetase
MSTDPGAGIIGRAGAVGGRIGIDGPHGQWSYGELAAASAALAAELLDGRADLDGARVAYLIDPGGAHVLALWAIWRAGGIAVPLAVSHPPAELEHVLTDSGAESVIVDAAQRDRLEALASALGIRLIAARGRASLDPVAPTGEPARALADDPAIMLYTSGTTGRPKGVVHTHASVRAQCEMLVGAWGWSEADRTLLVLPLHHVHGLINVVLCALWVGARCDVLPRFDADETWRRIEAGTLTVFMAVPTVYARLAAAWDEAGADRRARMTAGCRRMRLMVSGSAALPVTLLERWRTISDHTLLERYGMTELGMALSNPLDGERRPGHVGSPLPGVEVRLVDENARDVAAGEPGEILVRGPCLFREYWQRPGETRAAFTDSWFRTGDIAILEDGAYRILGRRSVDILKSGGYKLSALEIENSLRENPAIVDCAVVGLPDSELGERVAAAVIMRDDTAPETLRAWLRERIAPYKVPSVILRVDALPRNAMGKVMKPAVRSLFDTGTGSGSG